MAGNSKNKRKSAGGSKKLKTLTPVVFRFSKHHDDLLKETPDKALERFRRKEATTQDWRNMCFRISVGYELALKYFNAEEAIELEESLNALCEVKKRYDRMDKKWGASDLEIEIIKQGLEITSGMQDLCTRREQLPIYVSVNNKLNAADYSPAVIKPIEGAVNG